MISGDLKQRTSFMSFLGLVSEKYDSKRKQIGITKMGSPGLRIILTEAAWHIASLKQKARS
ncbi:transposase, IS116/IS110/IS902 family [Leptospira weilii str. Ecochallenge]|uniref:Transposase, IS116/IS110/IS902 family n=3 Tax=Leptospira weilii TaxID=28184 RepID=N1UDW9_9LEPT|nr:transposase, IS116/IS110/IS902 family [Leptospira weilii str. Ecochallenge]